MKKIFIILVFLSILARSRQPIAGKEVPSFLLKKVTLTEKEHAVLTAFLQQLLNRSQDEEKVALYNQLLYQFEHDKLLEVIEALQKAGYSIQTIFSCNEIRSLYIQGTLRDEPWYIREIAKIPEKDYLAEPKTINYLETLLSELKVDFEKFNKKSNLLIIAIDALREYFRFYQRQGIELQRCIKNLNTLNRMAYFAFKNSLTVLKKR